MYNIIDKPTTSPLTRSVASTNRHFPTTSCTHFSHSSWCRCCCGCSGCFSWPAAMDAVPSGCLIRSTPVPGATHAHSERGAANRDTMLASHTKRRGGQVGCAPLNEICGVCSFFKWSHLHTLLHTMTSLFFRNCRRFLHQANTLTSTGGAHMQFISVPASYIPCKDILLEKRAI